MSSRAAVVVGMHRSGTSTVARGLQALSVYLGDNFFEFAPDNPTGYWEDKSIVGLSQRVLEELQIAWDDTSLTARERFNHHRIRLLKLKAARYFDDAFASAPLWGFKDPRTIRLLPFWLGALRDAGVDDAYVVAIRHPMSVAASLFRRQEIPLEKANLLWLLHNVRFCGTCVKSRSSWSISTSSRTTRARSWRESQTGWSCPPPMVRRGAKSTNLQLSSSMNRCGTTFSTRTGSIRRAMPEP